jgi:hypothetical protein
MNRERVHQRAWEYVRAEAVEGDLASHQAAFPPGLQRRPEVLQEAAVQGGEQSF